LAEKPGSEDDAIQKIGEIRRLYKLGADSDATLAAAERDVITRKISSVT